MSLPDNISRGQAEDPGPLPEAATSVIPGRQLTGNSSVRRSPHPNNYTERPRSVGGSLEEIRRQNLLHRSSLRRGSYPEGINSRVTDPNIHTGVDIPNSDQIEKANGSHAKANGYQAAHQSSNRDVFNDAKSASVRTEHTYIQR